MTIISTQAAAAREAARQQGGQFGTQVRADNDLSLDERRAARAAARAANRAQVEAEQAHSAQYATLLEVANQVTRAGMSGPVGYGGAAEDVAQEVMVEALVWEDRHDSVSNAGAIHNNANKFVSRAYNALRNGNDPAMVRSGGNANQVGVKQFDEAMSAFHSEHGRNATQKEQDEIAERMRENWHDPRHKPREGFHRRTLPPMSIDAGSEDPDMMAMIDTLAGPAVTQERNETLERGSRAWNLMDDGASKHGAKRQVHNDIMASRNAPEAVLGVLSRATPKDKAAMPKSAEEVMAALDEWESGASHTPRADALFSVYGDIAPDQKDTVAEVYRSMPARAGDLFTSALLTATARSPR